MPDLCCFLTVNIIVKIKYLSNFDPKIIGPTHLTLNDYEYLRKEKNLLITTFSQKKSFVVLLNLCNFTNIANLMDVPLV